MACGFTLKKVFIDLKKKTSSTISSFILLRLLLASPEKKLTTIRSKCHLEKNNTERARRIKRLIKASNNTSATKDAPRPNTTYNSR